MNETKRRRTQITIETHSLTIIKIRCAKSDLIYCPDCRINVAIFSPPHASLIFRVDGDDLECLCQNNQIHYAAREALCGNSLAVFFRREIRFLED